MKVVRVISVNGSGRNMTVTLDNDIGGVTDLLFTHGNNLPMLEYFNCNRSQAHSINH